MTNKSNGLWILLILLFISFISISILSCDPESEGVDNGNTGVSCLSDSECPPPGQGLCIDGKCKGTGQSSQNQGNSSSNNNNFTDYGDNCPCHMYYNETTQSCLWVEGYGNDCVEDTECSLGEACIRGLCTSFTGKTTCDTDQNCGPSEVCLKTICVSDVGCYCDSDCGDGDTCDLATHECLTSGSTTHCTSETQRQDCLPTEYCLDGLCVQCSSDDECGPGLKCNLSTGKCISEYYCEADEECLQQNMTCNEELHQCVPTSEDCSSNDDCAFGKECNPMTSHCDDPDLICRQNSDCDNGLICNQQTYICESANTNSSTGDICISDTDCSPPLRCDSATFRCIDCSGIGNQSGNSFDDCSTVCDCRPGLRCSSFSNSCTSF